MKLSKKIIALICAIGASATPSSIACTGITLKSDDGGVVVSRTVEWALSDAQHNKILIAPRGKSFRGLTPRRQ